MEFDQIIGRLTALGRKKKLILLAIGVAGIVILAVGLAFFTFLLDWLFRLPIGVRTILAAGSAVVLATFAVRRLVRPLGERQTTDGLALMVERSDPALKDQLISALQLKRDLDAGRAMESPELIRVTVDGAVAAVGSRSFGRALSFIPAARPMMLAGFLLLVAAAAWMQFPDLGRLWLERVVLLRDKPWPKANELEILIADQNVTVTREGDRMVIRMPERTPLQVQVIARQGKILPDEVELVTAPAGEPDKTTRFAMGRPAGRGYFQHIFPPLSEPIVFYALGGDDNDELPLYEIKVARAPRIQLLEVGYEYPAYTGLTARTLREANIAAPEGTRLTFRFTPNMPLRAFDFVLEKGGTTGLQAGSDGVYTHVLELERSDFYTIRLKGANDINSADVPRHVITSEPDQPPRVQIDLPASNSLLCTPNAVIPLRGLAIDDYGVTSIAVSYGPGGDAPPHELKLGESDLLTPLPARKTTFYRDLLVSELVKELPASAPAPGPEGEPDAADRDRLRFKMLVTDNRSTRSQPHPHQQFGDYEYSVQVVSATDVERDLAQRQARLRERVSEIVQLAEARKNECEALIEALQAGAGAKPPPDKLAAIESGQSRVTSELSGITRQFQRVFDGYLYNRLDPKNLTEKLLVVMAELYRSTAELDSFKLYGEAISRVRPQANETELMGRLTLILDLFIRSAAERSPEVSRRLAQANLVLAKSESVNFLRGAVEMQKLLIEDLRALEEKLEAWEDYLDIVQGFKDLLDLQKGIRKKAEQLTK
jgi:hypothetical protein